MESYSEAIENNDHTIQFRVDGVPHYSLNLKLGSKTGGAAKMTTLLFAFDFLKTRTGINKLDNQECEIRFDEENLTTPEEILQTRMEEVLIKAKNAGDWLDADFADADHIYLNDKE